MIAALLRALLHLTDPPLRRVIALSIGSTLAAFLLLALAVAGLLQLLHVTGINWLDPVVDFLGGAVVLALSYLLFPAVVPGVSSLFLDEVAAAVERRHYPGLIAHPQPLPHQLLAALRFLGVSLALNLLMLPLYLIPGMNLAVFLVLNGYLLGRMYYEQVAARHLDLAAMTPLRRRHRLRLFVAGLVITVLVAIPLVNLLAPVIATAFMVHIFQRLPKPSGA
jgi:CysZ protein